MRKNYSRLARIEEKKNKKSALTFGILSVVVLIAFLFLGIPAIVRIASFVADLKTSGSPIEKNDRIAPPTPQFDSLPDYTNKDRLEVSGTTEAGATVTITINSDKQEVVSDANGHFTANLKLKKGSNAISAQAKDQGGNESGESESITIILDTESPTITISNPGDGASFSGSKNKEITVSGTTDKGANVEVNGQLASVDSEGEFTKVISLSPGENELTVKSTDEAGNTTEKSLTVNYSE